MGFVTGSSCFLQSPLYHFPLPCGGTKRKIRAPMASFRRDGPNEEAFCNKRTVILIGITVLPLLGLKAKAIEELATLTKESEAKTLGDNPKAEKASQTDTSSNPLSLLNGIGIFSTGVLGALYALAQQEKTAANATIETMESRLKEKEELVVSLRKNYESKLLNEQEERTKQLAKAKEAQQALIDQLNSAKSDINRFGKELHSDRKLIDELKLQIDSFGTKLSEADAEKEDLEKHLKEKTDSIEILQEKINSLSLELSGKEDVIQKLSSSLASNELELKNLNSAYKQTKDELSKYQLQIEGLKDELLKSQEELDAKNSLVDRLNERIGSLTTENDDSRRKYNVMEQKYNDLKLTSEKKASLDAKLLGEKEVDLQQLKEKLELALSEVSQSQVRIADLTLKRENLKESLENESTMVKNLKNELQITQENLGKSRNEAVELEKQLSQSIKVCTKLDNEVSKLSTELTDVRESLQRSLNDANLRTEMLASELTTTKEHWKKTQEELQSMSQELAAALENQDSLQRELVDVYQKAEMAAEGLREEKKLVASLKTDLLALEKQISIDKDAQKSLEKDLEEATKALDELNRNALTVSSELDKANSLISGLENEKEMLYKSLTEQKNVSKVAQENIEDAHNFIMKLGKEKENLENRGKKLEQELASAKGEILRLRSRINSSKVVNNEEIQQDERESKDPVSARKTVRRRRANPQ